MPAMVISININSNSNSNANVARKSGREMASQKVPTKSHLEMANPRPSSKLNVVPCTGCVHGTLPELVQRALDYYVTVCHLYVFVVSVCRGCVASPKACCLSLPPSNELPPFELLIAAGHSLSVPFNLGAISLLNRCEVMISSGEQG